ncbi:Franean1_4349 family RiPP [Candidatus Dojkabacteria bacterium]|nr:Franean1_4349 family RiPP [Candidatus Dojkabacteria bacterium]
MSHSDVQVVIGRAATDAEFRRMLRENPEGALQGFDLSDQEMEALRSMDSEKLESFSESLDERLTKGWRNIG